MKGAKSLCGTSVSLAVLALPMEGLCVHTQVQVWQLVNPLSCYVVRRGQWDSRVQSHQAMWFYSGGEFFQRIILFWGCGAEYQTQGLGYVGPVLLALSYTPSPLLTFPLR